MAVEAQKAIVRPLSELDIEAITRIDEKITGQYRPDFWEERITYYIRRDPDASRVAEMNGEVVGFMLADMRGGEFGLEDSAGWIERFGIDPEFRGSGLGKSLFSALTEYFESIGAKKFRTLVDSSTPEIAGFLKSLGFSSSPLEALEMELGDGKGAN